MAAVAAVAVAAAAVLVIRLTDDPGARDISDPTDLLLAPKDFPGTWEVSANSNSMAYDMFGLDGSWPEFSTELAGCIDMTGGTITDWRESGVYRTEDDAVIGDRSYGYAQTIGFLTSSETNAAKLVDGWRSPDFDGCLDAASSDATYSIGDEQSDFMADPGFSEPSLPDDIPESVNAAIRQIEIPLEADVNGDKTDQSQFVDVVAMSAGTAVIYLILRTDQEAAPDSLLDPVLQTMVDRLVE